MSVIIEGIRADGNALCFGNYSIKDKQKVDGFEFEGDIYRVKTHNELTRLEKNGKLLLEAVPGATIHKFIATDQITSFLVEGYEFTQITLELEPETEYKLFINNVNIGKIKSNVAGKINFSAEIEGDRPMEVKIEKA